jgi:hypothetical protein
VAALSDFNQRAYELFAQPFVQAMSNDMSARMLREFHPLRVQNWALSDMNPWLAWLGPAADAVRANRQAMEPTHPLRQREQAGAEVVSAALDGYRAMRDAMTEASFFGIYANMFSRYFGNKEPGLAGQPVAVEPAELPEVKAALAAVASGGYMAALSRVGFMLKRHGEPLPLSRLEMRKEMVADYAEYLPELPHHEWRKIRGQQEIIVRYAAERAMETLPVLLQDPADRERLLTLLDKLSADERVLGSKPTAEQVAMLARVRKTLAEKPERLRRAAAPARA